MVWKIWNKAIEEIFLLILEHCICGCYEGKEFLQCTWACEMRSCSFTVAHPWTIIITPNEGLMFVLQESSDLLQMSNCLASCCIANESKCPWLHKCVHSAVWRYVVVLLCHCIFFWYICNRMLCILHSKPAVSSDEKCMQHQHHLFGSADLCVHFHALLQY